MKFLLAICIFFIPVVSHKENYTAINIRVYNNSKYEVKEYTIELTDSSYTFHNIKPNTYSTQLSLPYLYDSHRYNVKFESKRFLRKSINVRIKSFPIDHVGEERFETSFATLTLNIERKGGNFKVYTHLKQE